MFSGSKSVKSSETSSTEGVAVRTSCPGKGSPGFQKNGVPEWCSLQNCTHPPPNSPCDQFSKLGFEIEIVPSRNAGLLCSPPYSVLTMGSFSPRSPILDIHMVKTHLRARIPRSPESDAPISSLYARPHFPRNQPVPATYSGTSLIRNRTHLRPYSRTMPMVLWWS